MNKIYLVTRKFRSKISKRACLTREKAIEFVKKERESDIPNREIFYGIEEIYLY